MHPMAVCLNIGGHIIKYMLGTRVRRTLAPTLDLALFQPTIEARINEYSQKM